MSIAEATTAPYSEMSDRELARAELTIARKYIGRFSWFMAVWGLGNLVCWLALWPLTLSGILPLWMAFPIATINVILCYLPSHEAQHTNFSTGGPALRWFNEFIGYVSTIPMVLPFKIARLTHMEHHSHTNDPELDPDYGVKADSWQQALLTAYKRRQPGQPNAYGETLNRLGDGPVVKRAGLEGAVQVLTFWAIISALAWSGHALEAAAIWWLPRYIGTFYISLYLSWAPHFPAPEQGRYRNTRHFTHPLGNILALGMEDHIIHHLHPAIPLDLNAAAYREMKPILDARGCRDERF
ncbi:beta-carotene hydroxylase [Parvibaculum sedimenti]|uniref:Beta-carotene hydroxylase n=1 Tax=Parvibaculum sedimenti TaxID=2608632 RepID=A0A6N6VJ70_9HYPH|nr:fatty acid desaturase [Parvibaculum sedimenti]KAB7739316.1 beta-carotene hydroxylase [Parvibaculum sedimenti]